VFSGNVTDVALAISTAGPSSPLMARPAKCHREAVTELEAASFTLLTDTLETQLGSLVCQAA
jgi:hypothetical protein